MITKSLFDLPFLSAASPGLDPVALDWATRVVANGGILPSMAYQTAVSDLIAGLKSDSIYSKFVFIHGCVPGPVVGINPPASSCWAPSTPILTGPIHDPILFKDEVSTAAGNWPTSGHANCTLNGVNTWPCSFQATPAAIWSAGNGCSATNLGLLFYSPDASYATGAPAFGSDNYNTGHRFRARLNSGATASTIDCGSNDLNPSLGQAGGLYFFGRSATNDFHIYFGSSTVVPASIYTNSTNDTADPRDTSLNFWWEGENNPAGGFTSWGANCSFVAGTQNLSVAEFALAFARIQSFRQAIGGGFA